MPHLISREKLLRSFRCWPHRWAPGWSKVIRGSGGLHRWWLVRHKKNWGFNHQTYGDIKIRISEYKWWTVYDIVDTHDFFGWLVNSANQYNYSGWWGNPQLRFLLQVFLMISVDHHASSETGFDPPNWALNPQNTVNEFIFVLVQVGPGNHRCNLFSLVNHPYPIWSWIYVHINGWFRMVRFSRQMSQVAWIIGMHQPKVKRSSASGAW